MFKSPTDEPILENNHRNIQLGPPMGATMLRVFVLWVLRCCEGGGCSGSGALAAVAAAALVAVLGLSLFLSISLSLSVSLSFSLSCCHTLAIFVAKVMDLPHTPCQPERTLLNPSIGHAFLVFCSLVSLSLSLCLCVTFLGARRHACGGGPP
jgi:hypothetical protein